MDSRLPLGEGSELVGVCMRMCALEQRGHRLPCPLSTPSADLFDLLA